MFEARRMRGEFGCFSGKSARMTGCEAAFAEGETAAHPPAVAVHSFELLSQLSLLEASFAHASFCGQNEGLRKTKSFILGWYKAMAHPRPQALKDF